MLQSAYLPKKQAVNKRWLFLFILCACLVLLGVSLWPAPQPPETLLSQAIVFDFPLAFVPNAGQQDVAVQFTANSRPGSLFFTVDGVQIALPDAVVRMAFVGANKTAVSGVNQLPGAANYYLGSDPASWQTDLPTFAAVAYAQIYPGIDLIYDGSDGLLKGTYQVAPGADPAQIRWRYGEETAVALVSSSGDLQITLPSGVVLHEKAPIAFQEIAGRQVSIPVQYRLRGNEISFVVGAYDRKRPLIIDPTLVYSSYLGGSSDDAAKDVAVDSQGNVYVTGFTYSTSFPGGGSGNAGYNDLFVTKINAAGTAVLYTTIIGGSGTDEPGGMAVNASGSKIWITGSTTSNNLPTVNAFQPDAGGGVDAFVMQLNSSGGLAFSSYYGGMYYDAGEDVALDSAGNAHITGSIWGGFFAKINGQTYQNEYERMISGQEAIGYGIALDDQDNIYITGEIKSPDWPTVNPVQSNCGSFDDWTCSVDAFVVKLPATGDDLLFSTYLGGGAANGGSGKDVGHAIAVDANGNIAVTGETFANDFPMLNAVQPQKRGAATMSDAFITRLVRQGSSYQIAFSTYLGGDGTEMGTGISMNTTGQLFAVGLTNSNNLPVQSALQPQLGPGVCFSSSSRNCNDAFIAQFNSNGAMPFSSYWGGTDDDAATGVVLDGNGSLLIVGQTESLAFPVTAGGFQATRGGQQEAFVVKLAVTPQSTPPTPTPIPGNLTEKVYLPAVIR